MGRVIVKNQRFVQYNTTPTLTTDAYTAGDAVGGLWTVTTDCAPETGIAVLEAIRITDLIHTNGTEIDVILFNDNPSSSTITNNAAVDIHDDDIDKIIAFQKIATTDYKDFADNTVAYVKNLNIPLAFETGNDTLYACFVERGTPTRAVGDLKIRFTIRREGG